MNSTPTIPILYEDNHLLIVSKPPNLPVQADSSGDMDLLTMLKAGIKERYSKPGDVYLGLVHRMDRPVGGVMAFARTSKAAARLSEQLRTHDMRRTYLAVVQGRLSESGELRDYLIKDSRTNMVTVTSASTPNAREAILHYRCLAAIDSPEPLSLAEVELQTGRSHQIRVQFASRGLPLWADARYGQMRSGEAIALWGYSLTLAHPTRKETMSFTSPLPEKIPWNHFPSEILSHLWA